MDYSFHIEESFSPDTIPMERLAEYLREVARLLGERSAVHFSGVSEGSVALHAVIDQPSIVRVAERISSIDSPNPIADATKAYTILDDMLRKDNATGSLRDDQDRVVIPFPGKNKTSPLSFGPFKQDGTLSGQVIRIGGKDETIPVTLRDGDAILTRLSTNEETALRLSKHYLGQTIRVHGVGTWIRNTDGVWKLESFKINDFDLLDETPLDEVVTRLRSAQGSEWGSVPDPVSDLLAERTDNGEAH